MPPQTDTIPRGRRSGFSLLEIVLALFILGVLAAVMAPSVQDLIVRSRSEAETRALEELAATITASFQSTDLTNLNVAALPGTIGATDSPTGFSTSTTAPYLTTRATDWFAKIARLRGLTPQIGRPPTPDEQPEVARIAFNALGNPRLLLAGPDEPGRQRFLLVSLTARGDQLILPAYAAGAAWFDAIWQHTWESRSAVLPAAWRSQLTAPQTAAWQTGTGGLTQVHRLIVRRITLPKFRFTVNNNHASETAWLSFNNRSRALTAPAGSGANVTPEILGGRLITLNRGASWPGVEALRFHLQTNDAATLQ